MCGIDCINLHNNVNFDCGFGELSNECFAILFARVCPLIPHWKTDYIGCTIFFQLSYECVLIYFLHLFIRSLICTFNQFIQKQSLHLMHPFMSIWFSPLFAIDPVAVCFKYVWMDRIAWRQFYLTIVYRWRDKYHRESLAFWHRTEFFPFQGLLLHSLLS